jgi:hypothetical protein
MPDIQPIRNMTIRHLTSSLALLTASCALTQAGEPAPAPPPPPPPEPVSLWSGSVTLGYDTDYIYRGFQVHDGVAYAEDLFTAALDLNFQVSERLTWNFNAWYGNSVADESDYDELDLYTRLLYKVNDSFSFGPSFKYYYYPVFDGTDYDEQFEPGLEFVWVPCANTTVNFGAFYETESDAFYAELGVSHVFKVSDMVSIVPGALVSYVDRDASVFAPSSSDFNHAAIYVKVPIALRSNVTLTPYVAVNFPFDPIDDLTNFLVLEDQDEEIYGGVALSVGF